MRTFSFFVLNVSGFFMTSTIVSSNCFLALLSIELQDVIPTAITARSKQNSFFHSLLLFVWSKT